MSYEYNNIVNSPNLGQIHAEVVGTGSTIEDKAIQWCRWDEDTEILQINFTRTLSGSDKNKLDVIIEGL